MSANATTAMHGQSSPVGPLAAAAVLTAVVAFGAIGIAIGTGVRPVSVEAPVAGPVIDSTSMSGPRTDAQKGLGSSQAAAADSTFPDYFQRISPAQGAGYVGSDFAGQYKQWLAAQAAAAALDFPDYHQRISPVQGAGYVGSDFAGQYKQWLAAQAAAAGSDFPDYFQRHATTVTGRGGGGVRIPQ